MMWNVWVVFKTAELRQSDESMKRMYQNEETTSISPRFIDNIIINGIGNTTTTTTTTAATATTTTEKSFESLFLFSSLMYLAFRGCYLHQTLLLPAAELFYAEIYYIGNCNHCIHDWMTDYCAYSYRYRDAVCIELVSIQCCYCVKEKNK